jgi:hypothetical protein
MAWATAEAVDAATAEARLAAHTGPKHRPTGAGNGGSPLASPQPGSLASLIARHSAQATRFQPGERKGTTLFVQPPKSMKHPLHRQLAFPTPSRLMNWM